MIVSPATPWVPFSRLTSPVTTRPVAMPEWKVRRRPIFPRTRGYGIDDLMYLLCSPDGTEVVILVGLRDAEEGDDGIADILFDEALISVNDLGDFAEDAGRDLLDLFGVELLGHGRVAREVGEEDGDVLAL